MVERIMASV